MKNLRLLENCFPVEGPSSQDQCTKLELISSKLIREKSRLVKERDHLSMQNKKQELCIAQLLEKLNEATDYSKDQQVGFDEAIHRQTETLAAMFQELSKSRNEIIQLRQELAFEKRKNMDQAESSSTATVATAMTDDIKSTGSLASSSNRSHQQTPNSSDGTSSINGNDESSNNHYNIGNHQGIDIVEDISDEDTVPIVNNAEQHACVKDVTALEDEICHLRLTMIQQEQQYKETLRNHQNRIDELEKESEETKLLNTPSSSLRISSCPSGDGTKLNKRRKNGLQEDDDEDYGSSRPPLFGVGRASSLGGFAQSLIGSSASVGLSGFRRPESDTDDDEMTIL